jgi:hypothetical protein
VRDSNHPPLQTQLWALGWENSVPKEKLVACTTVTFIGGMDIAKLMQWVWDHVDDPASIATFNQSATQTIQLSSISSPSLMYGTISLVGLVRQFRQSRDPWTWKSQVLHFLGYAEKLGFDVGSVDRAAGVWELLKDAMRVVAEWHIELMKKANPEKQIFTRKRDRIGRDANEMANLIFAISAGLLCKVYAHIDKMRSCTLWRDHVQCRVHSIISV